MCPSFCSRLTFNAQLRSTTLSEKKMMAFEDRNQSQHQRIIDSRIWGWTWRQVKVFGISILVEVRTIE